MHFLLSFLDYVEQKPELGEFYHRFPSIQNFKDQISEKEKSFSSSNRKVLHDSLLKQYGNLSISESVRNNLNALRDPNTYTVTTGHQLAIFTGPLYFIYKIVTVVNTCKRLKEAYPDKNFVPVYWMASEDHDYDEIKYFRLYGKKYVWHTQQQGAVGRFSTEGLRELALELPGNVSLFQDAYANGKTLAEATRQIVNNLFADHGVVVVDGDDSRLKSLFAPFVHEDLFRHTPKALVEEQNKKLNDLGYHTQVFARDINLFYLTDQIRSRIERTPTGFRVLDTALQFSEEEMEQELRDHPERFSPNVILRPLYQETILPNLAYVGGPAEMIYWLQLKKIFDHFTIPFPILLPRNFALVAEKQWMRKYEKTGLDLIDLFKEKNFLFNHWVLKNTQNNLTLGKEVNAINHLFADLRSRANTIDSSLGPLVGAEGKRAIHSLEKIERKLLRAEKRLHTDKLKQIESVKDALFPNGGLQERTDNFLNFFQEDPHFISNVVNCFEPFDFRLHFLSYHDQERGA